MDALLAERNVTRAAERLNVTQPTMSGMLQRIRYHFNDPILVRVGRHMELTKLAETLHEPVHEALLNVDSLINLEIIFDPKTSTRTFSIMASDYCTLILMPRVISKLSTCAPSVRVEIHPLSPPIERLISGNLDLCICPDDTSLLNDDRSEDIIQSKLLFSDEFVCVAARDHPLNDNTTLEEYFRYPHVGVQVNGLRSIEAVSMRDCTQRYKSNYTVADFSLIPDLVSSSKFTGIIQKRLAEIAAHTLDIKTFTPPFRVPDLHETMLWHPRSADDPSHIWLRNIISESAALI